MAFPPKDCGGCRERKPRSQNRAEKVQRLDATAQMAASNDFIDAALCFGNRIVEADVTLDDEQCDPQAC